MHYKIEKGTSVHHKVRSVWVKMCECRKKAYELMESLGFNEFGAKFSVVAGGIAFVKTDTKPEGFKLVGPKGSKAYYPKKTNVEVLSKFEELPTVSYQEYNDTIKLDFFTKTDRFCVTFSMKFIHDFILITIPDYAEYSPIKGMTQITSEQYEALIK